MIPKGPESAPDDRRPLTVLPVLYRLWARRHAAHLNEWLLTWKPTGLAGAVPNHSCPDILWQIQTRLAKARLGLDEPWFVLSMDLAQCFDRLDLGNLRQLIEHLDLPVCAHVLDMYQTLTRTLFVDGEPADV